MKTIQHRFVEFIPVELEKGVLYVSVLYRTAVHLCACGCGNKVVTPFSPKDWEIRFDGKSVSLNPSIGNWSFECRSHYWIKRNQIVFAKKWNDGESDKDQKSHQKNKKWFFRKKKNKRE